VNTTMTLAFTNLPSGAYDLYVYGNVNGGPADLDVSIGATTNHWSEPAAFDDATGYTDASDPNNGGSGNYVKFAGITPTAGGITVTATYLGGSDGLGIAELQLVTTGSFPPNTAAVAITAQPQPQLAAPGGTVLFSVSASGPGASYQWFKNGSPIGGATSSTYATPPAALSDDGAKCKVTVSNNVNSVTSDEVVLTVMNDPGTRAAMIGVSFLGNIGDQNVEPWRLEPTDLAGVLPQTNWNNLQWDNWGNVGAPAGGFVGLSGALPDSAGHLTGVLLQANCNDAWNADGPTDTANDRLMKGILKQGSVGSSMTLTFTNLPPAFYDVYVYGDVNNGPVDLEVSVGGTTNSWSEPAAFDDSTGFTDASDPANGGYGDYFKFSGVTPVSSGIAVTATYQDGSDGLGIAGLQIVSSAAFPASSPTLAAVPQGGDIVISWSSAVNFQLQYRADLGQGSWADEPTPPVVNGGQSTVTLPATAPARFFRLVSR
jgi:hypothetical protein